MGDVDVDEVLPLTSGDFQTDSFRARFPNIKFPGEDELWAVVPETSAGRFFKTDSWAWSFKNIFNHSSVASSDPEFVAKGKACSKGTVRPSVNSKKAALQRLVSRVFGFSPNARVPKFERWLSPVFLPKQQAAEDGTCRFNAACCFVVWYFGGTISLPVVEETIQSWYAGVVYLV